MFSIPRRRCCCILATKKTMSPLSAGESTIDRPRYRYRPSRSHYTYTGPGRFADADGGDDHHHHGRHGSYMDRGYTVGIGGPVGSGKTALTLQLINRLFDKVPLGVVTNDIFTQEDAQFLHRSQSVLGDKYIRAVETGGCPHAAIREDISANLTACEQLTEDLLRDSASATPASPPLILCESGGDNLAANFSRELADLTIYVVDVAGGDKVPRKGGPGITQSDLLVVNKIDLAEAVGADLEVMRRDADAMRRSVRRRSDGVDDHDVEVGPTIFASVKRNIAVDDIQSFILSRYHRAVEGGREGSK